MYVVEIDKIIEQPKDTMKCSVCGKYKHKHSFGNTINGKFNQSRTNCEDCYGSDNFYNIKNETRDRELSKEYENLKFECDKINSYYNNSVPAQKVVEWLNSLPRNSRVLITESGYYSQSDFADIYKPKKEFECNDDSFYSIGHSSQNH